MKKGYESLVEKIKEDCEHFDGSGQDKEKTKCTCRHCNKFKWIIERVKHYGEKTGLDWKDILASWEESCSYWYMNYYQDCNQPLIEGERVKVFESVEDMLASVGDKKFRCPACKGITTNPYACDSGLEMEKATKKTPAKVCNWKVYGLFGDLGKGTYIFCKDKMKGETIFTPISWESTK